MDFSKILRQEYDREYYLKKKLRKQTDSKSYFIKNPSQTYTMVRRNNIEKKLRDNECRAEEYRILLKSNETV